MRIPIPTQVGVEEKAKPNAFGIDTRYYEKTQDAVHDGGDIASLIQERLRNRKKKKKGAGLAGLKVEERETFEVTAGSEAKDAGVTGYALGVISGERR